MSVSPEISNQLFAAIDADKGDDTDQNHCAGGAEADDVFQILRAIFFETHFFCLHSKVFSSRETCDVRTFFFAANGKARQSNFLFRIPIRKVHQIFAEFLETVILFFLPESRPKALRQIEKDCSVVENCGPALTGKENVE